MNSVSGSVPNQMVHMVADLDARIARQAAVLAVQYAYEMAPKVTGASASRMSPVWGYGMFGIAWADDHIYFQEVGTRPRTMRELAGKVIPMWVDDPFGYEAVKNPRARRRVTMDGRNQVLIFRRAARQGETKTVRTRTPSGRIETRVTAASYPGAPGRISRRVSGGIFGPSEGKIAGTIAKGNVGVRWRHPGLPGQGFITEGLRRAAFDLGIQVTVPRTLVGTHTGEAPAGRLRDRLGRFRKRSD